MCAAGSVGGLGGRNLLRALGQDAITVAKLTSRVSASRDASSADEAIHVERGVIGQNVLGLGENIFDKCRRNDAQGDLAINAAEGQVVDLVAEGRNVGAFGGIDVDRENILAVEIKVRRQVERERRVSALVLAEALAVDPDGGGGHHAFEIDEDALAPGFGWKLEAAAIGGDELVVFVVEAVPGQSDVGVGDDDALESGVVETRGRAPLPTTVRLKRQLRFMGRTRRPGGALASAAALAKAERAMLAPAMNVPVVLRKLRRSMVPLEAACGMIAGCII